MIVTNVNQTHRTDASLKLDTFNKEASLKNADHFALLNGTLPLSPKLKTTKGATSLARLAGLALSAVCLSRLAASIRLAFSSVSLLRSATRTSPLAARVWLVTVTLMGTLSTIALSTIALSTGPAQAGELVRMKNQILTLPVSNIGPNGAFNLTAPRFMPTPDKVYYIIQFDGAIESEWKQPLLSAGIKLGSYLPDDAFLAKINSPQAWLALNAQPHVRAVAPFSPELRISQDFQVPSVFNRQEPVIINVKLALASELKNFLNALAQENIQLFKPYTTEQLAAAGPNEEALPLVQQLDADLLKIKVLRPDVDKLVSIEGVEWIEPTKTFKTYDLEDMVTTDDPNKPDPSLSKVTDYSDLTGYESGTRLMNFGPAYARGLHGEGEMIGIADTGLDRGSLTDLLDDFKGQIPKGYHIGYFAKSWEDPQGHGTHTAGSIIGSGVTSKGKLRGGAYGAQLIPQGLWSPMLNNLSVIPDFDKIFGEVRRNDNVHIHSDSWGSPRDPGSYDSSAAALDAVAFKNRDLLIVFAAGNSGVDADGDGEVDERSLGTPSTAKNCLTVGASKNLVSVGGIQKSMKELHGGDKKWAAEPIASSKLSDNPDGMAAFSSVGPTFDGRIKPDIVAPGTNILSTRSQQADASKLWGAYNQFYAYAGGTSMATPLTAAAAAVIRQSMRQAGFQDPSAAAIKAVMLHTATDLYPGQFGTGPKQEFKTTRPNNHEGYGRVDVGAAVNLQKAQIIDDAIGLKTKEVRHFKIQVAKGEKVVATMVYTDHPGSPSTAQALINDLDLKVVDANGKNHFPNHLKRPDFLNNVELVEFVAAQSGNYDVVVKGRNVPKGVPGTDAQPYALVLSKVPR